MHSIQIGFGLVAMLVVLAVLFDFMNGFHDAANSIATVVSTGVLKPQTAVLFAAFFNIVAIWIFHLKVAATVGKGIVDISVVDQHVIFGALVGAITWNVITWWQGIPSSSSHALIGGIVGAVIGRGNFSHLIGAVFLEAQRRLEQARPESAEAVRHHHAALIAFPDETMQAEAAIKAFLKRRMYRHERVMSVMRDVEAVVSDLFAHYQRHPEALPAEWLPSEGESETEHARRIGNFIAGMTDRFAITEHQRLFDLTPDLR